MVKNFNKQQAFLLGQLGELLSRNYFPLTFKGGRSHDYKLPTFEKDFEVEVKTCKPSVVNGSVGYKFQYTKPESRADFFCIICISDKYELERVYWIKNKFIPKRHRAIWMGKFSSKKWSKFRIA